MSWLESASGERDTADIDHRAFLRHRVAVERDLDTGDLIRHHDPSGVWIHAWPTREALAHTYGVPVNDLDAAEMTGAQL